MEEMIELLNVYFKKIEDIEPKDPITDKEMIEGDYWEFTNPKDVQAWSLKLILHTDNMNFNMKYYKSSLYLPISFDEKVKRITNDKYPTIKIHCMHY